MGGRDLTSSPPSELSTSPEPPPISKDELIRIQFYKTYDVMTGVRIAATLGGFFSLMVLLVVYKSKCKSRSLSDEDLEAAVAAAVDEEEKLEMAFGPGLSLLGGVGLGIGGSGVTGGRRSLGNMSAPVYPGTRFSSVGGGSCALFAPPHRLGGLHPRVSLPTCSPFVYPSPYLPRALLLDNPSPKTAAELRDRRLSDGEEDEAADYGASHFLRVPSSRRSSRSSRRLSSVTCSSCDTSYLERRGSAVEMGRPIPPPSVGHRRDRLDEEPWDFYYPIDIQVIQPTPDISPCESQTSLYAKAAGGTGAVGLDVPGSGTEQGAWGGAAGGWGSSRSSGGAPLASISSCRLSPSLVEHDPRSVGSDSVFLDEELIDTEDEVEEFSTDSDIENIECDLPSNESKTMKKSSNKNKISTEQTKTKENRVPIRRFSTPTPSDSRFRHLESIDDSTSPSTSKMLTEKKQSKLNIVKTSSESDTLHAIPPSYGRVNKSIAVPRAYMSVSCDQLVKILQEHSSEADGSKKVVEHCTWSQETLF